MHAGRRRREILGTSGAPYRVAIIGAGLGGIAAAAKLQKAGIHDFVLFEKADGPGGVWWANRYPGCEVDIPSHAYSYSFFRYDWPKSHASQPELLNYIEAAIDHLGIRDRIRLRTEVTSVVWNEEAHNYTVHAGTESTEYDAVVSAVGLLSIPRYPDWPGLDTLNAITFHTARWEDQHELHGKRIAVVGTGSTAAQVVPALAPIAGHLLVYQREPGWVEDKSERVFGKAERWVYRNLPLAQRLRRLWIFYQSMRRFEAFSADSRKQRQLRQECEAYIRSVIDDESLRDAVTPDYPWGCKRVILASTYYHALTQPRVELVPHAVVAATETGLVDDSGAEREIDVLVLATGFQPTAFLAGLKVTGTGGVELHDAWVERATALLGVTVPGFPNFFIMYGPNTNGGLSIIAQMERQAELMVRAIMTAQRRQWAAVDTRPDVARRFVHWIDRQLDAHASAMASGCRNYYYDAKGHNVTQWPLTHFAYYRATRRWARGAFREASVSSD